MKKLITLLTLLLIAFTLFASGKAEDKNEKPVLKLGTETGFPPSEFKIDIDGEEKIVGSDIFLAEHIAAELGMELEIIDMAFDTLLLELNQGRVDMVIAGLAGTPERAEIVELTTPYHTGLQTIVTLKENANQYKDFEDFDGKIIGAQQGTIQEKFIVDYLPKAQLFANDKLDNLFLELMTGRIDAMVIPETTATLKQSVYPELEITLKLDPEYFKSSGTVAAIKKGNIELLEKVNAIIEKVVEDGTFLKWRDEAIALQKKYLG